MFGKRSSDISHVFFWQSPRSQTGKHITQTGSVTFCIYTNADHHNIRPFFITTHQQCMPLALYSLYISIFSCNTLFQKLKILAELFSFFGTNFSSFKCHYPPKEGQRSILQTCLLYLLLYQGAVVNDQVLLTIYLFCGCGCFMTVKLYTVPAGTSKGQW